MPVPKKRTTSASRKQRRSHHALAAANLSACSNCAKPVLSHHACQACGHYKGRKVLKVS